MLFGAFLRFAPKNSRNKRFSDVFTQRINVVRLTTKTVFVSYLFLVDSIPGLPKTTSNQEAVFESPQTQIHYWRTQQWKNTSMTIITDYGMNCKEIITSLAWYWMKKLHNQYSLSWPHNVFTTFEEEAISALIIGCSRE